MTATNRPDIAGSASSRFGIIETNAIRATDSAAKTALRAILDVFSFPVSYQDQSSAARDKIAAHALAAAVGAEQTGANIAGTASARRFAGAAEAAVLRRVEIFLCRRIFAVVGIHSARAVKILRCIVEPAASLLSRALEIIPLCSAILLGNSSSRTNASSILPLRIFRVYQTGRTYCSHMMKSAKTMKKSRRVRLGA